MLNMVPVQFERNAVRAIASPMPEFHCFFLDAADQVAATLTVWRETLNEAQAYADKVLAASDHVGVEVWVGGRRLYRSRKPGPSTLCE
jgi:hypothetical protein